MTDTDLPFGLGTYENDDPDQCAESVRVALDAGYRHVDTAQMYGNEAAVGEGLAAADVDREDVFVATKLQPGNLAYDDVLSTTEESRDRLGVDTIDLMYVHWPLDAYDPEETLPALDAIRDRGLVRHVGLSNFTPDQLTDAIDRLESPLFAHQVEMHPYLQQAELRDLAREHDHYLVAYSPLAKGSVADDDTLRAVAEEVDATAAQVALAWLRSKERVVPIPKATGRDHIEENLASLDVDLDDDAIERIDELDRGEREVDFPEAPWNG